MIKRILCIVVIGILAVSDIISAETIETGRKDLNSALNGYYDEIKAYTVPDSDSYYDIYDRLILWECAVEYNEVEKELERLLKEKR